MLSGRERSNRLKEDGGDGRVVGGSGGVGCGGGCCLEEKDQTD